MRKYISYQRAVWPCLQDQKSLDRERWRHLRRKGEDGLSWENGDSRTDPTSLQKAGLQLFPTSHAPAVWNLLSCSYRCKSSSYTKLPKRALARALRAAKERPGLQDCFFTAPTWKKPMVGPQHPQDSSGLFISLLWSTSPVSASLSPSCHPQPRVKEPSSVHQLLNLGASQPQAGLQWKYETRKPWPVPLVSTHHDVPLWLVNVNMSTSDSSITFFEIRAVSLF